jgi:hypothetical protein
MIPIIGFVFWIAFMAMALFDINSDMGGGYE